MAWKVIVADDEYFIRQRIKKIIPWEELDLEFIGEAENGQEALTLLTETLPDILLLDIKMPKLTGMDISDYVHHYYPFIKVIILTGHNEFEYARTALRNGVVDYLLKPVDEKDLKKTLITCIELLKKEKESLMVQEKLEGYERAMAISKVSNGVQTFEQLKGKYTEFSNYSYSYYICAYFNENGYQYFQELSFLLVRKGLYHISFQDSDTQFIFQIFQEDENKQEELVKVLQRFLLTHKNSFLCIGKSFSVSDNWKLFYKELTHEMLIRYFVKLPQVLLQESHKPVSIEIDFQSIRQTVIKYFNNQDEKAFCDYVQNLFEKMSQSMNPDHLYLMVSELFLTYTLYLEGSQVTSDLVKGLVYSVLEETVTLEILKQTVISHGLICLKHDKTTPMDIKVSKKIIDYIEENYRENELSVTKIAEFFQMNVSYMGSLFKKVNGLSILQYITHIRMENAKKLLENSKLRVFEVAEQVGYADVFYFSRRFKKSYGCSPKDYASRF